jgi:(1->4)-alpha-D-glucan 1-alpha-D-glucosylmutase
MSERAAPASTYRLQITGDFDLHAAARQQRYIAELGAGWVYLSPVLQAEPGSTHGYDVVDHGRVDEERGGEAGLFALCDAAHALGLGVLLDIVPNHMGVATPARNAWWWDLLRLGPSSRYAEAFDVDWDEGGGRVRLPVLGDDGAIGDVRIEGDRLVVDGLELPIAPGTADDVDRDGVDPRAVLERQHYELMPWRRAADSLNYRRFFAVDTLAGVRVEVPWVYAESHREIVRWIRDGLVDGLRIDHPDGLADPGGYLDALAADTGHPYLLVEKILTGDEQLPTAWPIDGTTGYDALAEIDRVLIDGAARRELEAHATEVAADSPDGPPPRRWSDFVHDTKREVADRLLRSEVLRIERDLRRCGDLPDGTGPLDDAIAELLACFPVYRSYLPVGAEHLDAAAVDAGRRRPDLTADLATLLPRLHDPANPAAIRFQQTSGMVMAKGVEDNAFYRSSRLGSLTEVGGDPAELALDVDAFHRRQQLRQASFPRSLTTLSTHDTKRGEDVRARLHTLSELPDEWRATWRALQDAAPIPDGPVAHVVWQGVIGAWPASRERLHAYAEKAAREAGTSTSWTEPDTAFEDTLRSAIDRVFDDPAVAAIVTDFVDRVRDAGWSNGLSAKLLQLAAPGVPDVYQGSELWEMSLVDPDNRRPVDFGARRALLERLDDGWLPPVDDSGAAKLLVTSRTLRLRRDEPDRWHRYAPVAVVGSVAEHAVAFDRGGLIAVATRLPIGLAARGGWDDTAVVVAGAPHVDVLTGRVVEGGTVPLADLLVRYPVALLTPAPAASAPSNPGESP